VHLPDMVARDLLTAALARIVFPDTRINVLGYVISCTSDGGEIQIRDGSGALLDHLEVAEFIRVDIDADIEAATARERIEPTRPRG
jgi:hypothetical protein